MHTPPLARDATDRDEEDPPSNALDLSEGVGNTIDYRAPTLQATTAALPSFSRGDGAPARPQPPEAPTFPRMEVQMDEPQRDAEATRRGRLMSLLGALGAGIAAGGDSPVALNIAAGMSQGASRDLRRRRQEFKQRQKAFTEMVTEAERFNRAMKQREAEADYERRLSAFEQGREDVRQHQELTQDVLDREDEQAFERSLVEMKHGQTLEEIETRGQQERRTQRVENQRTAPEGPEDRDIESFTIPRDPERARQLLGQVEAELRTLQQNRDAFVTPEINARGQRVETVDDTYLDQLSRLQRQRAALQQVVESSAPAGGGERQGGGGTQTGALGRRQPRQTPQQNAPQGRRSAAGLTQRLADRLQAYEQIARQESPRAAIDSLEADYQQGRLSPDEARLILETLRDRYGQ